MKAIVRHKYGSPDVLTLEDLPKPTPAGKEVLVRVVAASVAKGDWEILRGSPLWVRFAGFGLLQPRVNILGYNLAGRVEAVGDDVTEFQVGDEVFGDILHHGLGAFAEYVSVAEDAAIIHKPAAITFEEAASIPEAGCIALQAIRHKGRLERGQNVLINGAAGGAGSFAIQLARSIGAEVTGVDRTEKLGLMRSLGADQVVDYTQTDLAELAARYDLILDVVGVGSVDMWKRLLRSGGTYLAAGGSVPHIVKTLLLGLWVSKTTGKKFGMLALTPSKKDMLDIVALLESGKVKATVERSYPLHEVPDAIRHLGQGLSQGKVVVTI